MTNQPTIEDAPGLTWRPRKWGYEARWRARADLVAKGYKPKSVKLWIATEQEREPSAASINWIVNRSNALQAEMLSFSHGGLPEVQMYDGTIRGLVSAYQTDPDSNYRKLRYRTRENYDGLMRRIVKDRGDEYVSGIKARALLRWHEVWAEGGKIAISHSLIGSLRTLMTFGATILDDEECRKVKALLHDMKFPMIKPRTSALSAEQATMVRAKAHEKKVPSIALAQAFQFDCILRQKDVIGEWVPISEPGISDVTFGNDKWLRGLRWEEIDKDLVLHHITSKRNKMIDVPLCEAPMVMEEFRLMLGVAPDRDITRDMLPAKGPIIMHDRFGTPWINQQFRRRWRELATDCGIPKTVFNMDSRAGAISEATDAGADLEHVRHAATHGDIKMTQRYSRNAAEKTAGVMRTRASHRTKNIPKT